MERSELRVQQGRRQDPVGEKRAEIRGLVVLALLLLYDFDDFRFEETLSVFIMPPEMKTPKWLCRNSNWSSNPFGI